MYWRCCCSYSNTIRGSRRLGSSPQKPFSPATAIRSVRWWWRSNLWKTEASRRCALSKAKPSVGVPLPVHCCCSWSRAFCEIKNSGICFSARERWIKTPLRQNAENSQWHQGVNVPSPDLAWQRKPTEELLKAPVFSTHGGEACWQWIIALQEIKLLSLRGDKHLIGLCSLSPEVSEDTCWITRTSAVTKKPPVLLQLLHQQHTGQAGHPCCPRC